MKKLLVFVFALMMGMGAAWAQCTPDLNQANEGFAPEPDSQACIVQGEATSMVIYFRNFNQLMVFGQNVQVDSIRIDSINNLPSGLTWVSNKDTVPYTTSETGCISITGTTNDQPCTYRLDIIVTAWINGQGFPLQQNANLIGLGYHVTVTADSNSCVHADTTGGGAKVCLTGIREYGIDGINSMTIMPNPFNGVATVTFTAQNTADYTATLYDVTGKVMVKENIDVVAGQNRIQLNGKGLSPGMYLYTISDGVHTQTQRVIITE